MKNFWDVFVKYFGNSNPDYNREATEVADIPGLNKFWKYFWSFELPVAEDDGVIGAGTTAAAFAVSWCQTPMKAFLAWLSLECNEAKRQEVFAELHDYAAFAEASADAVDLCMVNDAKNLLERLLDEGFKIPGDIVWDVLDSFRSFKPSHRFNKNELDYLGYVYSLWAHGKDSSHPRMRGDRYDYARRESWEAGSKRAQAEIAGPLQLDNVHGFTHIFNRAYDIKIRKLENKDDEHVFFVISATNYGEEMEPDAFGIGPAPFVCSKAEGYDKLFFIQEKVYKPKFTCYIYATGQELEFNL